MTTKKELQETIDYLRRVLYSRGKTIAMLQDEVDRLSREHSGPGAGDRADKYGALWWDDSMHVIEYVEISDVGPHWMRAGGYDSMRAVVEYAERKNVA